MTSRYQFQKGTHAQQNPRRMVVTVDEFGVLGTMEVGHHNATPIKRGFVSPPPSEASEDLEDDDEIYELELESIRRRVRAWIDECDEACYHVPLSIRSKASEWAGPRRRDECNSMASSTSHAGVVHRTPSGIFSRSSSPPPQDSVHAFHTGPRQKLTQERRRANIHKVHRRPNPHPTLSRYHTHDTEA